MAGEDRRAAHRLRGPHFQRDIPPAGLASAARRAVAPAVRRGRLRASVQAQRQAAFEGDVWQWHQDYGTWARDDGMPQARAMNIAVFLDEVMPINGALMLIPKSHKQGVLAAGHDEETTS